MQKATYRSAGLAVLVMAGLSVASPSVAHEAHQTHRRLTIAAFELFKANSDYDFFVRDGINPLEVERELTQGAMDEDYCIGVNLDLESPDYDWGHVPNFWSHFYEPATNTNTIDIQPTNDPSKPGATDPCHGGELITGKLPKDQQMKTPDRAGEMWEKALTEFEKGDKQEAYRLLGRVLHLMEDMTQPAHIHNDPHAHLFSQPGEDDVNCSKDIDDFENWGWCPDVAEYHHILDYFRYEGEPYLAGGSFDYPSVNSYAEEPEGWIARAEDPDAWIDERDKSAGVIYSKYWNAYDDKKVASNCDGELPPEGFTCRLWQASKLLYDGKPASVVVKDGKDGRPTAYHGPDQNAGEAFARRVAEITYDFTSFKVFLDDDDRNEPQPDSELNRMLRHINTRGANECKFFEDGDAGFCEDFGDMEIFGPHQQIGKSQGKCGALSIGTDGLFDETIEEWWVMEHQCGEESGGDPFPEAVEGYVYIENVGGEGEDGRARPRDDFIPLRYGCESDDGSCGLGAGFFRWPRPEVDGDKTMFKKLYGSHRNQEDNLPCPGRTDSMAPCPTPRAGKTMLRIYGDVLWTSAVAHAAGLIEAFIDEVSKAPTAEAGGPYEGEACQAVMFDGSGSSDQEGGLIVSYDWDFTADGAFDDTTSTALTTHVYPDVFSGQMNLKVTDDEGFTDEDLAEVTITPDVTPPNLDDVRADPPYLWPPNHKMVPVTVSVMDDDACAAETVCVITNVTSNQPVRGRNDHTSPDWVVTEGLTVDLRAERLNQVPNGNNGHGNGNGNSMDAMAGVQAREYELTVMCTDAAGNSASGEVIVPVNRSTADNRGIDTSHEEEPEVEPLAGTEDLRTAASAVDGGAGEDAGSAKPAGNAFDLLSLLLLIPILRHRKGGTYGLS